MRTIKFRAWDKKLKLMAEVLTLSFKNNKIECVHYASNGGVYMFNGEKNVKRYYLMQFTGLKDKNGKEIYEGDIYIFNRKTKNKYIVKSMQEFFEEKGYEEKEFGVPYNNIEVIGNIHEDKNLITKVMQVSECCGKFITEEDGTGNGRCSECKEWSLIIDEEE